MLKLHSSLTLAFAFLFVTVVSSHAIPDPVREVKFPKSSNDELLNIDKEVDESMPEIRNLLVKYEPIKLGDIIISDGVNVTDGYLTKLPTLERNGKCTTDGKILTTFNLYFGWKPLEMNYNYSVSFGSEKEAGIAIISLEDVSFNLVLGLDTLNHQITMKKLNFNNIKTSIKLYTISGPSFDELIKFIIHNLARPVVSSIPDMIHNIIGKEIEIYNINNLDDRKFIHVDDVKLNFVAPNLVSHGEEN